MVECVPTSVCRNHSHPSGITAKGWSQKWPMESCVLVLKGWGSRQLLLRGQLLEPQWSRRLLAGLPEGDVIYVFIIIYPLSHTHLYGISLVPGTMS